MVLGEVELQVIVVFLGLLLCLIGFAEVNTPYMYFGRLSKRRLSKGNRKVNVYPLRKIWLQSLIIVCKFTK